MKTWNTMLQLPTALFLALPPLGSCAPTGNRDDSPASPFSLSLKGAGNGYSPFTTPTVKGSGWNLGTSVPVDNDRSMYPTPFGIITVLSTYYPLDTSSKNDGSRTTKILCLDLADGSLKWARTLEPASSEIGRSDTGTTQDLSRRNSSPGNPSPVVTNPNGHHLAVMVKLCLISGNSSDISDQRMRIVVIDTEIGDATHTFEVSGLVPGQVLTNDSLVVETSQYFCPTGIGTLNVSSLTEAQVGPASFRTDRWLVGATPDSLLASPQNLRKYDRLSATLIRISTSGEELGTAASVTAVRDRNWISRYQDPEIATAVIKAGSKDVLSRELFNIDSGAAFDITDLDVVSAGLFTGPGFLLRRLASGEDGEQKPFYVPVSWLPVAPDSGELHTDDVAWFGEGDYKKQGGHYIMRAVRMGEKPS